MISLIMPLLNNDWKLVYFFYSLAPLTAGLIWLIIANKKVILHKKESTVFNLSKSVSVFKLIVLKKRFINIDASKPITLDFLTNPDKEWTLKEKMSVWV